MSHFKSTEVTKLLYCIALSPNRLAIQRTLSSTIHNNLLHNTQF